MHRCFVLTNGIALDWTLYDSVIPWKLRSVRGHETVLFLLGPFLVPASIVHDSMIAENSDAVVAVLPSCSSQSWKWLD